jgi:predicted dehydrogenase
MFKMSNGASGMFCVSEISAGRGCFFNFEVNGSKSSTYWNQERADELWVGFREQPNQLLLRNPNTLAPNAHEISYLAKGHPEGWNDAFKGNFLKFYNFIAQGKKLNTDTADFSTFENAHYIVVLTEAILKSSKTRQWVSV